MQRNPQRTCAKQSNEEDRLLRKPLVSWIFSCGEHLAWCVWRAYRTICRQTNSRCQVADWI